VSALSFLKAYDIAGTWADVAGLVGFTVTIWLAFKARSAAVAAKDAAEATRDRIRLFATIVDFQAVISTLEQIKRSHRQGDAWASMPERYAEARRNLILLRGSGLVSDDKQLEIVQIAITNLSEMERLVEKAIQAKTSPRGNKLNALLSDDGDALLAVLQVLRNKAEASDGS
jgi:hypothetical protein